MPGSSRTLQDASQVPIAQRDDDDMVGGAGTKAAVLDSPKRERTDPLRTNVVTVDLLRQLLTDQHLANGETVQKAVSELEDRQGKRFEAIDRELRKQARYAQQLADSLAGKTQTRKTHYTQLEAILQQPQGRVDKIEQMDGSSTAASSGSTAQDSRFQTTLVFGGFPQDTRRATLVQAVQAGIKELGLQQYVDQECFATGPRRVILACLNQQIPHQRS